MSNKYHYLLVTLLGVAGILIILIFVSLNSQTDNSTLPTSATVTNYAPSFESNPRVGTTSGGNEVSTDGHFNITNESGTHTIYVNGNYSDNNGCFDVENALATARLELVFYNTADFYGYLECINNDTAGECYSYETSDGNCNFDTGTGLNTCDSASDLTGSYECYLDIPYFSRGTDDSSQNSGAKWVAEVRLADESGSQSFASTTFELNTFTAISIPQSLIDFESVTAGATSSNKVVDVINEGNDEDLDVHISNSNLVCSVDGTISANNIFASQDVAMTDSSTADIYLTVSPAKYNLDIDKDYSYGENNSSTIYFMLEAPTTGIVGTCVGTTTLSAVS